MSLFREPPSARRNALELGLIALLIVGLVLAVQAPSIQSYLKVRREAVGLGCQADSTPEQTRARLGGWLLEKVVKTPAEAKQCSIAAAPPRELSAGLSLGVALLVALLVIGGLRFLPAERWIPWPRGKLLGARLLFIAATTAGCAVVLAALLRYRLFAAHEDLAEQFKAYSQACDKLRETASVNHPLLLGAASEFCRSNHDSKICSATSDILKLDAALRQACAAGETRGKQLCDLYRIDASNRGKLVAALTFESCEEAAQKLPLPALELAKKAGAGNAEASALEPTSPAPTTSSTSATSGTVPTPPPPGSTGPGGSPQRDDAPLVDNLPIEKRTVVETLEREVRRAHPGLSQKDVNAILRYMLMGLPLPTAFALHFLSFKGGDVEATRQRIVTEIEGQVAQSEQPHVDAASADEVSDRTKRNPALRPVLDQLPETAGVARQRATLDCASKLGASPDVCSATSSTAVTSFLNKTSCGPAGSYDPAGVANLACCNCATAQAGCQEIIRSGAYACR